MTPEVRYVTSHDGWRIAFSVHEEGRPVLLCKGPIGSHLTRTWGEPRLRVQFERLGAGHRLIRFDPRGSGLSQRGLERWLVDDVGRDIEAILDASQVTRCDLVVVGPSMGPPALAFLTSHPERVRRLVLIDPVVALRARRPTIDLRRLKEEDPIAYWQVGEQLAYGLTAEQAQRAVEFDQETITFEDREVASRGTWAMSAAEYLAQVTVPTLVVATKTDANVPIYRAPDEPERVAAGIPGARFVACSGWPPFSLFTRALDWLDPVVAFLDEDDGEPQERLAGAAEEPLSAREREVLALIAAGKTNPEIAHALTITAATASKHVHNILEKLGMSRRSEAAAWWAANRNGRRE